MRLGGRLTAAIEVLEDVAKHHRPASQALADWGRNHRFAGSGDRAAIGNIVYDVLRARSSLAWRVDSEGVRVNVLAAVLLNWSFDRDSLASALEGDTYAPEPLNDQQYVALKDRKIADAPEHIQADVPEWLWPRFQTNFDDEAVVEGQALTQRPPVDLRVNTLKADREKVVRGLKLTDVNPTSLSSIGLRIPASSGPGRTPNITSSVAYQKGWCEVQDEGSQIASQLVFARDGEQVLDFCAGAGGKTLALSAAMENKGQVFAFDRDQHRLAPIYERLKRAGTRNVQVLGTDLADLEPLVSRMHRVVVDAPCTGSGVWRRRPDAKWKLTPENLGQRMREQAQVLDDAKAYVRPGGYLCYITCSLLPDENERQIEEFLIENPEFELVLVSEAWQELYPGTELTPWSPDGYMVTLTPASTQTDGFFFAVMERRDQN